MMLYFAINIINDKKKDYKESIKKILLR